jgi:hypothetical protein
MDLVRDTALGVEIEIDPRFARIDSALPEGAPGNGNGTAGEATGAAAADLPTAHFIAADPGAGWIAALAMVTVASEPGPADEWLAGQLERARASFAQWSPAAHEMLVVPEAAELAGRPAIHVRYRLTGDEPEGTAGSSVAASAPVLPASLVEHWTVLVAERSWLLALELMVQPPERWDQEREILDAPFRTLSII